MEEEFDGMEEEVDGMEEEVDGMEEELDKWFRSRDGLEDFERGTGRSSRYWKSFSMISGVDNCGKIYF